MTLMPADSGMTNGSSPTDSLISGILLLPAPKNDPSPTLILEWSVMAMTSPRKVGRLFMQLNPLSCSRPSMSAFSSG